LKRALPYGSWPSPLTAADAAAGEVRYSDLRSDATSLFWVERRPAQAGRGVLVGWDGETCRDISPPDVSVGSRVHEYGGAPYGVAGSSIVFSSRSDDTVWLADSAGEAAPKVLCRDGKRYADFVFDSARARWIAVCEEHTPAGVFNRIVAISVADGSTTVLAEGRDFYAAPTLSPDGRSLAWLTWSLPAMPWEWTELWSADVSAQGELTNSHKIYGSRHESLLQPQWSPDGELFVISDTGNWWNLYRVEAERIAPVFEIEAECAAPMWNLGLRSYHFFGTGEVAIFSQREGVVSLHHVKTRGGEARSRELPLSHFADTSALLGDRIFAVAASPVRAATVVSIGIDDGAVSALLPETPAPGSALISQAETITFTTRSGAELCAFLYPPGNADCDAPPDQLPPLLVRAHGGPTVGCTVAYSRTTQFWTTRGFAVLDVDYTGSAGYGRERREALRGQWGLADVCDCIDAARFVAQSGRADAGRLLITGGSAGGYDVLCALAFHPGVFAAGASYYGVADVAMLAESTHKFEAGYDAFLMGTGDRSDPVYRERSPISAADRITDPLIVFQGNDDAVVPPVQARLIIDALGSRGIRCDAHFFDHEGHGFRDAANIAAALDAELAFYRSVLGITGD
jgi:dipeptidyl aminopeptidase/acylaminoacyl peptidase